MIEKIKNKSFILIWGIIAISFYFIFISAIKGMFQSSFAATILFLPCLVAIVLILTIRKRILSDATLLRIQIIFHILSLLLMIVIAIYGAVNFSWDWGKLIADATGIILNGKIPYNPEYYLRYPNNQFWLTCLTIFFSFCKNVFHVTTSDGLRCASVILSILFVRLTYIFLFLSSKLIFETRRARIFDILSIMFVPLYLYAQFAYSDTVCLLLVSILIYIFLLSRKKQLHIKSIKHWIIIFGISIIVALIYHIKIMALIVPIAMAIYEFIDLKTDFKNTCLKYLTITMMSISLIFILSIPIVSIIKLDTSEQYKYKFPPTHWIMMALNTTGGYNSEDRNFTQNLPDYETRKTKNKEVIKERLDNMGIKGIIKHTLDVKLVRQWGNAVLAGDDYISRQPVFPESLVENIFGQKQFGNEARYHWICLLFAYIYYILMIIGCISSIILSFKNRRLYFSQITILGIFLFFSIWECNSRYLLAFTPVLLLNSFIGWVQIRDYLFKNTNKIKKLL